MNSFSQNANVYLSEPITMLRLFIGQSYTDTLRVAL